MKGEVMGVIKEAMIEASNHFDTWCERTLKDLGVEIGSTIYETIENMEKAHIRISVISAGASMNDIIEVYKNNELIEVYEKYTEVVSIEEYGIKMIHGIRRKV